MLIAGRAEMLHVAGSGESIDWLKMDVILSNAQISRNDIICYEHRIHCSSTLKRP